MIECSIDAPFHEVAMARRFPKMPTSIGVAETGAGSSIEAEIRQARINRLLENKARKQIAAGRHINGVTVQSNTVYELPADLDLRGALPVTGGSVSFTGLTETIPVSPGQVVYGTKDVWVGVRK